MNASSSSLTSLSPSSSSHKTQNHKILSCFRTAKVPHPRIHASSIFPLKKTIKKSFVVEKSSSSSSSSPFPANLLNAIDDFINTYIDPASGPNHALSNNNAPVNEHPPVDCPVVEGKLPASLDGGAYIRNGPNPQFLPRGPYHMYDGDGMLHSVKISNGRATYCCRFVQTNKYLTEKKACAPLIPGVFSCFHGLIPSIFRLILMIARVTAGQINLQNGVGNANTSLAVFAGNLYALVESDLPYAVKLCDDGDMVTIGRHDFSGSLKTHMTAHPKIDQETGEVFAFRYNAVSPFLTFFRINPDGKTKQPDVDISSVTQPGLLHDFGITNRYAIFPDIQILIKPMNIIKGKPPIVSDRRKVPRIGVIPRYAEDESEMKWFDVPGFNALHMINAWDEDDGRKVVIIATNILTVDNFLEISMDSIRASVEKVEINLEMGTVKRRPLSERFLELAVINPSYLGKKNRYVYAAILTGGDQNSSGVVKMDTSKSELGVGNHPGDCIVADRLYGSEAIGGEPFFVARNPNDPNTDEDEGYVLCYVHDGSKGESSLLVMDAKSPNLETVAAVKLPQRVPNGFHGIFVRHCDLKS